MRLYSRGCLQVGVELQLAHGHYIMQTAAVGDEYVDTISKLTREFGLTPAGRSRIYVNPPADDGEAELWRILSQPRVKPAV